LAWSEAEAGDRGDQCRIRLWDLTQDKDAGQLVGPSFWVDSLAFSADGRQGYFGCRDGVIGKWDLTTGKQAPMAGPNRFTIGSLYIAPDGATVAVRNVDHVRFWDVWTGCDLGVFPGYQRGMKAVAFTPDWRTLALGDLEGSVSVWEVGTRRLLRRLIPQPALAAARLNEEQSIIALAFSPDGKYLAMGGWNAHVYIWDWETGQQIQHLVRPERKIIRLTFLPEGTALAALALPAGTRKKVVRVWDLATGQELPAWSRLMNDPADDGSGKQGNGWLPSGPSLSADGRLLVHHGPRGDLGVYEVGSSRERIRLRGQPRR
jgi:WD40 repeat protein